MKAGIIGAGALGSLFAHIFSEHNIDTVLYEVHEQTVSEIKSRGITLIRGDARTNINPRISTSPEMLSECDVIFLFVKSYSTEEAVRSVSGQIRTDSVLVTLQNGLGNVEEIRKHFDSERIVYGTTTIGAAKSSMSEVVAGGSGIINIGGSSKIHLQHVHGLLLSAKLDSHIVSDPDLYLWQKAVINAGINPIAAILGIPNGGIISDKNTSMLQENVIREAVNSALANDIKLDFSNMLAITRQVCERTSINLCSMLQDIRNSRKTEIESINGKIISYGETKGIELPANKTLYLLIKSMEAKGLKE
jgi:2-dehydropantoate 2-reductase